MRGKFAAHLLTDAFCLRVFIMKILLSHLGEVIVAEMAQRKRRETLNALGMTELADLEHVYEIDRFAHHECRLAPHDKYIFDGASRVDVVLWIKKHLAVALELKLGKTRLTKTRIDGEFLADCRLSHNDSRLAGNMMAILDRRFGNLAPKDGLSVELHDHVVPLAETWFIVTRQTVLNNWFDDGRPTFSENTECVAIGTLVEAFGGKTAFNNLVTELLEIDYFDAWIN
jgi:hypothetical protein